MPHEYHHTRRVEFSETDMAGIVHFAQFYRYMEEAEHAFFRSVGLSVMHTSADGTVVGWPRVNARCSFKSPAYFGDLLGVRVSVDRIGVKSLTLDYTFTRDDTLVAEGTMKTVACRFTPDHRMTSVEVPAEFLEQLQEAPRNAPDDRG